MIKKFNSLFVTLCGVGTIKYAPGTAASFLTVLVLFYLFNLKNFSSLSILVCLLLICFYSFYAVKSYIIESENKDPKEVVIDEVIGQAIPICLYELAHGFKNSFEENCLFYLYIFILFRFFDIKKPFPISYFDKNFKNSFGVIFDDVLAGLYVVLTLIIFMFIKTKLF